MICISFVLNYSSGGMGDMLRFMMTMFAFSKETPNTRFMINMSHRPDLVPYFTIGDYYKCLATPDTLVRMPSREALQSILHDIKRDAQINENRVIYITSNEYGFVPWNNLERHLPEFRNHVFTFSENVHNNMVTILPLPNQNYTCLHIRCGDYAITNMPRNGSEKRLDVHNPSVVEEVCKNIDNSVSSREKNMPIVLHSDSEFLKDILKQHFPHFLFYPSTICHIAEEEPVEGGYLSTITEFFFMANAKEIIQIGKYSGFSHISAIYGNVAFISTEDPTNHKIMKYFI